jgi:glycosyltransferase involved in cell wall biosynthesis
MVPSQKIKVLHYGSPPPTYGSPSFYKAISHASISKYVQPSMYHRIFDVDFFSWTKRLQYKMNVKTVYLVDFFSLVVSLFKRAITKDIIVALGYPALVELLILLLVAKLRKVPIVVRETHWYWPQTRISRLLWYIYLPLLRHVDALLTPGLASFQYWKKLGFKNVYIVHYYALEAIMQDCGYARAELRKKLGIQDDEIVFLYLGRLIKKKGIDILLKAFAQLTKETQLRVKLLIAGAGPERQTLEKLATQLGVSDKVIFLGPVPETVKKCIYQVSDVFVYVPIVETIPEEWPIAPLEAMSVGLPTIVSTAVGSLPDLRGGVLPVRWGDAEQLYRAMRRVVEDKNLRRYLAESAIKTYRRLATDIKVQYEFLKVFTEIKKL